MDNLFAPLILFQSKDFWNEIEKCDVEEERQKAVEQIRINAQKKSEKMFFLLVFGCLIASLAKQIF